MLITFLVTCNYTLIGLTVFIAFVGHDNQRSVSMSRSVAHKKIIEIDTGLSRTKGKEDHYDKDVFVQFTYGYDSCRWCSGVAAADLRLS